MSKQHSQSRPRSYSTDMLDHGPFRSPVITGRPRTAHVFATDRALSYAMREQLHLDDLPTIPVPGQSPEGRHRQFEFDSSLTLPPFLQSPWEYRRPHSPLWPESPEEGGGLSLFQQFGSPSNQNSSVPCKASPGDSGGGVQQTGGREIFTPRTLPARQVLSRCIDSFFKGNGIHFHFIQEVDIMEYFSVAYSLNRGSTGGNNSEGILCNGKFCLLLLVAAVGAQYLDEDQSLRETRERLFNSGKWYLDIAFGRASVKENDQSSKNSAPAATDDSIVGFLKMSASAITGLYLIFEKNMAARDYIEQAIRLAQSRNLHMDYRNFNGVAGANTGGGGVRSEYGSDDWESWRRVWESLVFVDGWLSSSVGYQSMAMSDLSIFSDASATSSDANVRLQAEMAKLGNLMSSITRDICIPTEFDVGKVREYWSLLKTWHEGVPEFLRLSGVTSECSDYAHKTSVLLTHCAYLGSIMLLTKRVLVERVKEAIEAVPSHVRKDMDEFSLMNISAARQLAQVVGMLFQEGRLVRKCWLGIQSSFISCLIIFLDLALARREYNSQPTPEDVELVAKCIAALEFCACTDTVAKAYLEILLPIRNVLIFGPRPHTSIRPQRPQYLQHRSSSHSSSASSSMSRSPSASPSKRPRVLPSSRSNSSTSMSVGNSPTYIGSSFQHRGSFHWTTTTNRMDQMFRPEDGVITGSDPRIHLLITHILEHIYSPYGGEKRFSEDQFQQGNNSVKRRYIDLKTKAPGTNSSMGPPSSISTPCSYQHIQHNQYDQHYTPQNGQGVQQRQNQPHNSSHHHGHTYRYKSSGAECPTVATSGGPLPNVWMETGEDYDVNGRRRRKMPFKSMEEYENFLRRVA